MSTLQSRHAARLRASNSTNSGALALTGGRYLLQTLIALGSFGFRTLAGPDGTNAARGLRIGFMGTDAANETFSARVFQLIASQGNDSPYPKYVELRYWGLVDVTLGAAAGVDASDPLIITGELIADTLAYTGGTTSTTPDGVAEVEETALGSPGTAVYSPANDLAAYLTIPDFGGAYGVGIEFSSNGKTAASMNAWIEALV